VVVFVFFHQKKKKKPGRLDPDSQVDDIIYGCYDVGGYEGVAGVIFGAASYGKSYYDLTVDVINSVSITTTVYSTLLGLSVAGVRDVNKDGYDDFLIGRPGEYSYAGSVVRV